MEDAGCFPLRKFVAPEFILGNDARFAAPRYARNFGIRKALVVTDSGVTGSGWTDEIVGELREANIEVTVFSGVTSNPRAEEVMNGAAAYVDEGCNGIIAVGGGSPMDCAKGIGIVSSAPERHILDFQGMDMVDVPAPPLICIPTTAGTAAEVSQFAIITDLARKLKVAIVSKAIVPDVALIDPVPTTTVDPHHTACTALDAFCHGMEAYVSAANSPVIDIHALEGIRLIWRNLLQALDSPEDLRLRGRLMLASLHSGLAFSNAGLGAIHALAHSVGGLADFSHGEANALLAAPVILQNFESAPERYRAIAETIGAITPGAPAAEVRDALVEDVVRMRKAAGISSTLGSLGVTKEDLPQLAANALLDPCLITNPRQLSQAEIEEIYASIL
jgi:alcohol dehydrogenase